MRKIFLLLAVISSACTPTTRSLHFSFPNFTSTDQLNFGNGPSSVVLGAIQVTPDVNGATMRNRAGRALFNKKFKLWTKKGKNTRFVSIFDITMVSQTDPGGEGLAFILTSDPTVPPQSEGQWLGIVSPSLNGSAQAQTVAIEFDTRKSFPDDVDDNHVGLDINSVYSTKQFPLTLFNLSSGFMAHVNIQYYGKNLSVTVNNNETAPSLIFSEEIDLSQYLPEEVYVGFSASTSNFTQLNCVNSWSFDSIDDDKTSAWIIAFGVCAGVILFAVIAVFVWWWWRYSVRAHEDEDDVDIEDFINAPTRFNYKELIKATNSFNESNFLGEGGFGKVYKGVLNGETVAVKKIRKGAAQGKKEFLSEVKTIGNTNHRNLVKLIGWCCERGQYVLVYEYMANGSLERFITSKEENMDWKTRINVLSGVAKAVAYLHGGSGEKVFHRDIKPSNIMLDSDFNAKLGDFGLARKAKSNDLTHHSTMIMAGTPGYLAPEISFTENRSTTQTDVYSFGVVILEVACGRGHGSTIVNWVWDLHEKGTIVEAADSLLWGEFSEEEVQCLLILGLACCHPNPYERPSMNAVVQILSGDAPVPEVQKERPRFVWPVISTPESDFSLVGNHIDAISIVDGR